MTSELGATKSYRGRGLSWDPSDRQGEGRLTVACLKGKQMQTVTYGLIEIRCDLGGRGFQLEKLVGAGSDASESCYHVHLATDGHHSCDCRGFTRHHACKHVDAIALLADEHAI